MRNSGAGPRPLVFAENGVGLSWGISSYVSSCLDRMIAKSIYFGIKDLEQKERHQNRTL